jgi:CRISPR-associated protein Csn2
MTINIDYLDNYLYINNEDILNIEIENKKYFYRVINDFFQISNGENLDYISCLVDGNEENIVGKIAVFTDYFNFDLKKNINVVTKYIIDNLEEYDRQDIVKCYHRLLKKYASIINKIDLPVMINDEINIERLMKSIKLNINFTNDLLDNLCIIIDMEREISINKLLIFVNLKQYLTKQELIELYKYSLYHNVKILLIDSQSYGPTLEYEKKLIIDDNLIEIVV